MGGSFFSRPGLRTSGAEQLTSLTTTALGGMSKSSSLDPPEDPGGPSSSSVLPTTTKDDHGHDRMNSSSFPSTTTRGVVPPAAPDTQQHAPPRVEQETRAEAAPPSIANSFSSTKDVHVTSEADEKCTSPPIDLGLLSEVAEQQTKKEGYHGREGRDPSSSRGGEAIDMHRPTDELQPADPAERSTTSDDPMMIGSTKARAPSTSVQHAVGYRPETEHGRLVPGPDNLTQSSRNEPVGSPPHDQEEMSRPLAPIAPTSSSDPPRVATTTTNAPVPPARPAPHGFTQLLLSPAAAPLPPPPSTTLPSAPQSSAAAAAAAAVNSTGKKRPRSSNATSTPTKKYRKPPAASSGPSRPANDGGSPLSTSTSSSTSPPLTAGRWTAEEHRAFLSGLATYGREWKRVALHIPTRTSSQVRSHAQKYFTKLQQLQQAQSSQSQHPSSGALEFQGESSAYMDPSSAAATMTASLAPFSHGYDPNAASRHPLPFADPTGGGGSGEALTPSVQANVERILAQPETVQAEVDDTLQRLRERYRHLQHRLRQRQLQHRQQQQAMRRMRGNDPHGDEEHDQASVHSNMSMEGVESVCNSLQDSELIALHVLQGGLEHQSTAPSASSTSSSPSHDTSTLTNTVDHANPDTNHAHEAEDKAQQAQQQQQHLKQEPEVDAEEEEVRPNPQDPPSAANPYP